MGIENATGQIISQLDFVPAALTSRVTIKSLKNI